MESTNETGPVMMTREFSNAVLPVTIILGIMGCVGLLGNLCVLYVYKFKYPRCNFRYFVLCLAIVDFVSCLVTIPGEIFSHRTWFNLPDNAIWFCKAKTYFNGFTVFVSAFFLLLIAIERFRKVCKPHGWQISPRRAIQLCVMIFIVAVVLAMPAPFLWGKQTTDVTYKGANFTICMCEKADQFKHTRWPSLFVYVVFFAPTMVFMLATAILYGMIMREIFCGSLALNRNENSQKTNTFYRANTDVERTSDPKTLHRETGNDSDDDQNHKEVGNQFRRSSLGTSNRSNNRKSYSQLAKARLRTKTMIMFVVTVIFTITTMVYFAILAKVAQQDHTFILVSVDTAGILVFFWRLYFINHVINPVIYGFMDTRFQKAIHDGCSIHKSCTKTSDE